ncbi:MAG: undecaprenyl-diphosphate phosphatase [Oligoflexia bacterium]|nr:undecaprenyl-diphosphate phosphatase [Oligoflexia bacterium]
MDLLTAIVYGIIQGLAEFLPISSSAHLALLPKCFKFDDPGVFFDLMMHLGTTLALVIYFWKKIFNVAKVGLEVFPIFKKNAEITSPDVYLFRNFLSSTFFTVVVILILKQLSFNYGRNPHFMAINLIVFGILLYLADYWARRREDKVTQSSSSSSSSSSDNLVMNISFKFKESCLIGIAQALAIFPGVSRSGITITISRFLGLSRVEAAEYTFFLSIPIILLAAISKIAETLTVLMIESNTEKLIDLIIPLATGLITSFVVGIATIHFFMKLIKRIEFLYFAIYRLLVAIAIFYFL